jgi:hypothetical protein
MMLILFNIFHLVSYGLYEIVIFEFHVVQIYGSGLNRHNPDKDMNRFQDGLDHCFYSLG